MAHSVRVLYNPSQKTIRMHYASKYERLIYFTMSPILTMSRVLPTWPLQTVTRIMLISMVTK